VKLAAAVTFVLIAGCKQPERVVERDAERIFATQCAKCHAPDGRGVPEQKAKLGVRDLTDAGWQRTLTDLQIADSIRRGKKNMPAWGRVLDDEQVEGMVRKVRALASSGASP